MLAFKVSSFFIFNPIPFHGSHIGNFGIIFYLYGIMLK